MVPGTAKQQISFADWELKLQRHAIDPILQQISDFLSDNA